MATLERPPFSGPVASAGELLHTPWRVPTSVATVLLSGAIDTFLWDLMSVDSGTSAPAFGSSRIASSAYQKWPTGHCPHSAAAAPRFQIRPAAALFTDSKFEIASRWNVRPENEIIGFTR